MGTNNGTSDWQGRDLVAMIMLKTELFEPEGKTRQVFFVSIDSSTVKDIAACF